MLDERPSWTGPLAVVACRRHGRTLIGAMDGQFRGGKGALLAIRAWYWLLWASVGVFGVVASAYASQAVWTRNRGKLATLLEMSFSVKVSARPIAAEVLKLGAFDPNLAEQELDGARDRHRLRFVATRGACVSSLVTGPLSCA